MDYLPKVLKIIKYLALPTTFSVAVYFLYGELSNLSFTEISMSINNANFVLVLGAVIFTVINFLILTRIDYEVFKFSQSDLTWKSMWLKSLLSYVFSYNLGAFIGSLMRVRLLQTIVPSTKTLLQVVISIYGLFWLAFLFIGGAVFVILPLDTGTFLPSFISGTRIFGAVLIVVGIIGLFLGNRKSSLLHSWLPVTREYYRPLLLSALDWVTAGIVFYLALVAVGVSVHPLTLFAIFMLAQIVSIVSAVPAGIGVFEATLVVLVPQPVVTGELVAGVLLYRVIYYLLPFVLSILWWFVSQVRTPPKLPLSFSRTIDSVTIPLVTILVYVSGSILLFSSIKVSLIDRLSLAHEIIPEPFFVLSDFYTSLVGVVLIMIAWAIQSRTKLVFVIIQLLLLSVLILSLTTSFDIERIVITLFLIFSLTMVRHRFTHHSIIFSSRPDLNWILLILLPLTGVAFLEWFAVSSTGVVALNWWEVVSSSVVPLRSKILFGIAVSVVLWGIYRWLKPITPLTLPDTYDLLRACEIVNKSNYASGTLVLTGDKYIFFNSDDSGFVMYGVEDTYAIALNDPIAPNQEICERTFLEFLHFCNQKNLIPGFYEVSETCLSMYIDAGLVSLKLGEEAVVDVQIFSLEGKSKKKFRNTLSSFERDGYVFATLEDNEINTAMSELLAVSDIWLANKGKEMGYSVGTFSEAYLRNCLIVVVRDSGKNIVAFANVLKGRTEFSIDMMRYNNVTAPPETMMYLFVQLIMWGKENDYLHFNMGMAPLAGLPSGAYASVVYKIGNLVFEHSKKFYSFKGLHAYKDKFTPTWHSRYLVSPNYYLLFVQLKRVRKLIKRI